MNENIKKLRQELGLTMEEFGKNLGVTRSAISNIENGYRNLTEQMILAICNVYNVNEQWLRNGTGDMFVEDTDSLIEKIISDYPLDKLSQTILKTYIELDPKKREIFNYVMKQIADSIMASSKEQAINGINDVILNSSAPDNIKKDMYGKAAMVFNEAFPYTGFGNSVIPGYDEQEELSEKEQYLKMAEEQYDKEKEQELKASSAKESDVG